MRTVTATLTSSAARPIIDVTPIPAHTNEMGVFEQALDALGKAYRRVDSFPLVTYDAGACSAHHATLVRARNLHLKPARERPLSSPSCAGSLTRCSRFSDPSLSAQTSVVQPHGLRS